jgi:glucose-6-phosphate 1-epimerase
MSIIKLRNATGELAEVRGHGAHVTSWRTSDGAERLFLSQRAEFQRGAAIRGGVPIIFPQFAGLGPILKHGFARTAVWQHVATPDAAPDAAVFQLQYGARTHAVWPYRFAAEYAVRLLPGGLELTLSIRNIDTQPFEFTAALHTYLRVANIAGVSVQGLQCLNYLDSAAGGTQAVEASADLQIVGEVDRIYCSAPRPIRVIEAGRRTVMCSARGFTDVVVWNPGAEKAMNLADLEPGGFRHMLCVEAAVIGTPVVLQPQAVWSGTQYLQLD